MMGTQGTNGRCCGQECPRSGALRLKPGVAAALPVEDARRLTEALEELVRNQRDARNYWRLTQIRNALYTRLDLPD